MKLFKACPVEANVIEVDVDVSRCYHDMHKQEFWIEGICHHADESEAWTQFVMQSQTALAAAEEWHRGIAQQEYKASIRVLEKTEAFRKVVEAHKQWLTKKATQ